jgi:hypothetical protein
MPAKTLIWAIALYPPKDAVPATATTPAQAAVPASIGIPAKPAVYEANETPDFATDRVSIATNESFSFTISSSQRACNLVLLPLGWRNGGCPPPIQLCLNNLGTDLLKTFNIDPAIATAEACRTLHCQYNGAGMLTCSGKGVSLSTDLTSAVNYYGLCLASRRLDTESPLEITFGDPSRATIKA